MEEKKHFIAKLLMKLIQQAASFILILLTQLRVHSQLQQKINTYTHLTK